MEQSLYLLAVAACRRALLSALAEAMHGFHTRIIESQNDRMAWIEKDHNDHRVSIPLLCAGSPTTRPSCYIQPGLEYLQGWGIHNLLGRFYSLCVYTLPKTHCPLGTCTEVEIILYCLQQSRPLSQAGVPQASSHLFSQVFLQTERNHPCKANMQIHRSEAGPSSLPENGVRNQKVDSLSHPKQTIA